MEIMDLYGKKIKIIDLQLAILQADDFRHYQLNGSDKAEYNRQQQAYWEDIYIKLMLLEQQQDNHETEKLD
ncbi:hypothetical protein [Mucilaginibacter celer]|uniref:3-isopropylmalate dehydratase n=1 Tax=Mucilaginibacter celer TaxID=2305508 RepID=A0A494VWC2_9SPHI|nr:hypothetical protein [Mucilaginibacter celer]AYL95282.1 hypothetical protein HYN43_008230 [Mucilaginibacter celer]